MTGFDEILSQLRGVKLAAFDSLIRFGDMGLEGIRARCVRYSREEIAAAVAWLESAYLAREVSTGIWRLRTIQEAEKQYLAAGRMKQLRTLETNEKPETNTFTPANEAPAGRRVHTYQAQMFAEV